MMRTITELEKLNTSERNFVTRNKEQFPLAECMIREGGVSAQYINVGDFAKAINVSYSRAKKICTENEMDYYMVDGDYRLKRTDVDMYLSKIRREREDKAEYLEPLFTIQEVAQYYHVTPNTVEKWIKKGMMPAYKIGGKSIRVKKDDIGCMLERYGL